MYVVHSMQIHAVLWAVKCAHYLSIIQHLDVQPRTTKNYTAVKLSCPLFFGVGIKFAFLVFEFVSDTKFIHWSKDGHLKLINDYFKSYKFVLSPSSLYCI